MRTYFTTAYFNNETLIKRPYISKEICIQAIENAIYSINQHDGRIRFWSTYQNKYLRVITLGDGCTIHNAFLDRNFDLKKRGLE